MAMKGAGTREKPWKLKTPGGKAEFVAFRDETLDPPALVVSPARPNSAISCARSTISTRC